MDTDTETFVRCSNPDCRVAENQKCVEGLELATCPNYGKCAVTPVDDQSPEEDEVEDDSRTSIELPTAEKLLPSIAAGYLRKSPCRMIAIIGPYDSGKTSLIASLYDRFQLGAINGVEFAASATLHAFELACHDARLASARTEPFSPRTARGGVSYYHLQVSTAGPEDALTLLFGDRSGEEYRDAADDVNAVDDFSEVARADVITLLADGQRLLDLVARHNVTAEIELIVQALVEAGIVSNRQALAVVMTKLDAVQASEHAETACRQFDNLVHKLRDTHGNQFSVIESFRVAASPKVDGVNRGTGLPELLSFWLAPQEILRCICGRREVSKRAFGRLTVIGD